jgi:hypothetical protein
MWSFRRIGSQASHSVSAHRALVTSVVAVALVFGTGIAVSPNAHSGAVHSGAVHSGAVHSGAVHSGAPADNAADPQPSSTPTPAQTTTPTPTQTTTQGPAKVRPPKPASRTHKARNVPEFPRDTHHGRRIVYDKALMTVWVMGERDQVIGRYPVVGRFDRPVMGTYRIFSKSKIAYNPNSKVTFNHMMRFTYGPDTKSPIGLHAIPRYYDGTAMHSVKQLGLAIAAGGCVRLSEEAAAAIYKWAKVGDRVIVLPSP